MSKNERVRDLRGKRVRLTRDIRVKDGTLFPRGEEFTVMGAWRSRYHLVRDDLHGIRHLTRRDFELVEPS